jgi:hypothetical protein
MMEIHEETRGGLTKKVAGTAVEREKNSLFVFLWAKKKGFLFGERERP